MSRQASWDSKSRTVSVSSMGPTAEIGQSAPMMKVIGQLWCHEVQGHLPINKIIPEKNGSGFNLSIFY